MSKMHDKHEKHNHGKPEGTKPDHTFDADTIARAKAHFWTLDTSHRYNFITGTNNALFRAMLTDDPDHRLANEAARLDSQAAPTLSETAYATDGEAIHYVEEPKFV
jgi:hypothetical protein